MQFIKFNNHKNGFKGGNHNIILIGIEKAFDKLQNPSQHYFNKVKAVHEKPEVTLYYVGENPENISSNINPKRREISFSVLS